MWKFIKPVIEASIVLFIGVCILTFINYLFFLIFGIILDIYVIPIGVFIIAIFYAFYKWTTGEIIPFIKRKLEERRMAKAGIHFHFHKH